MVELSAFFTLLGIISYIDGRLLLNDGKIKKGYLYITLSIAFFMPLGILSKENAILLCLYLLLFEWIFFQNFESVKFLRIWKFIFLITPLIALSIYLAPQILPFLDTNYPYRNFSAIQRLITEPRVLVDYLSSILLPRPRTFGLFNYNYEPSNSLTNPISTLYSLALISALVIAGIFFRKILPLFSFGILFYMCSHLLESTIINLELFFEHRNYLGLFGILLASYALIEKSINLLNKHRQWKGVYAVIAGNLIWIALVVAVSIQETRLWQYPIHQLSVWAAEKPNDHRAQGYYGLMLTKFGWYKDAENAYSKAFINSKDDLTIPILWLGLQCFDENISPPDINAILKRIEDTSYHHSTLTSIDSILLALNDGACLYANIDGLTLITQRLLKAKNYQYPPTQQKLHILLSKLYFHKGDIQSMTRHLRIAIDIKPRLDALISLTYNYLLLKEYQNYNDTYLYLDEYCTKHRIQCFSRKTEIEELNKLYKSLNDAT
jgi:tetratricopeptide (TPR) repeat protein